MDIKQIKTASPKLERCVYLGLREDPQTALAFPSVWNFCHKVRPPRTVALAYQRDICQLAAHRQCPIVEAERVRALPPEARGRNPYGMAPGKVYWIILVVLALLAIGLWLLPIYFPALDRSNGLFGFFGFSSAAADASTQPAAAFPGAVVTLTAPASSPSTETSIPNPSAPATVTSDNTICGYQLDQTIHAGYELILHRASGGESLNKYAGDYNTSVNAILAANYQLPVPLRVDWVLVIPVGISDVQGMPPFEPYFESTQDLPLIEIAQMLSISPTVLRKSNGFTAECQTVTGWLLVPRPAAD